MDILDQLVSVYMCCIQYIKSFHLYSALLILYHANKEMTDSAIHYFHLNIVLNIYIYFSIIMI